MIQIKCLESCLAHSKFSGSVNYSYYSVKCKITICHRQRALTWTRINLTTYESISDLWLLFSNSNIHIICLSQDTTTELKLASTFYELYNFYSFTLSSLLCIQYILGSVLAIRDTVEGETKITSAFMGHQIFNLFKPLFTYLYNG